tara:strand:+ start:8134 stop:8859 length:726 start_codon:yes stop_codon:yes gene_type:complete
MSKNILNKKNCFITGATGGIGKEICKQLAEKNCNLFLTGTNPKKLKKLKNDLKKISNSIDIGYANCDISNLTEIKKLIKKVRKNFGHIDIIINSAGIFEIKSLNKSTVVDFDESFNVNVRAPFIFSKEFSRDMVSKKWGRIVNLGSSSSYAGFKNGTVYSSTKHAILGLTRALNSEFKEKNIRALCISPGSTKTKMARKSIDQNFKTFLDPKEVAQFIIFSITFDNEMIADEIRLNRMIIE